MHIRNKKKKKNSDGTAMEMQWNSNEYVIDLQ